MANAALLLTNLAVEATLTASSALAGMGVSLLVTSPHVRDDQWQAATEDFGWVQGDIGADTPIDTVALFGLNLTEAGTVRVRISTESGGASSGDLHDQTYDVSDAVFDPNYGAFVLALAAPVSGRYVLVDFAETGIRPRAGVFVFGLREALGINFAPGAQFGWQDPSAAEKSRGGQTLVWERTKYRVVRLSFGTMSDDQRWGLAEDLMRLAGVTASVLLLIDPEADNLARMSIWGRVTDQSLPSWSEAIDTYATQIAIEERL